MAWQLNATEYRAWRAFLDAHARLMRQLEKELVADDGMTLAEFDVLIQLWAADDRRLRMTDLSERVRLSPSGITRLVDRLVRMGLVKRGHCASDRRGTWAILTTSGRERVERARPLHLAGVHRHFGGRLTSGQLRTLTVALEQVAEAERAKVSST